MNTDARSTPSSMTTSGPTSVANTSATEQMERLTKVESQISELTALVKLLVPKAVEPNDAKASVPVDSGASSSVNSADPPRNSITATVPPKAATGPPVGDFDDKNRPTDSNEAARDRLRTYVWFAQYGAKRQLYVREYIGDAKEGTESSGAHRCGRSDYEKKYRRNTETPCRREQRRRNLCKRTPRAQIQPR
jgi:hypothetical protein